MIAAHFPDLFHRQPRLMDQKTLGVAHAQGDQIFGRGTAVDLAENFGQVAGTVVHVIGDQVQINVLAVVFYNEIFHSCGNLSWCHGSSPGIKHLFVIISGNLKFLFDLGESFFKLL